MPSPFSIPLQRNAPQTPGRSAESLPTPGQDDTVRLTSKHVSAVAIVAGGAGLVATSALAGVLVGTPLLGLVLGLILVALILLAGLMI